MERIEPTGDERADWRVALATAQIINNVCAALGAKGRQLEPKDLLLRFTDRSLYPEQNTLKMKLRAWLGAARGGGRKKPRKR